MPELIESLPFKSQVLSYGEILIKGQKISAQTIVEKLTPHLTSARIEKIEQVIRARTKNITTVTEYLYDIGNISAVMRSAESFGFLPFHIIERRDAKYKMSDRISKGTEKWLDIHKHKSTEDCFVKLKNEGYQIFATDLSATHSLEDIDFKQKTAIVLGNEKDGISDYARTHADGTFIIPMHGFAQSFNISVAGAIVFSTINKIRAELGYVGDLSSAEITHLRASYYMRSLESSESILSQL